jgi:HlyD family secretion protein
MQILFSLAETESSMKTSRIFSLTPGFSPVGLGEKIKTVSTVFSAASKPLKRLAFWRLPRARLKPGVDEIIFCALAAAAALVAGCSPNSANQFQGYIEGEYVYVASPLGGALTNLAVARGDSVTNGQLLFGLERSSEADAVRQAGKNLAQAKAQLDDLMKGKRPTEIASLEAQLQRAKANLRLAEDEFARREKLGGSEVISKEELDQARAQRDANQAQVEQLTADLETAKLGGREDALRAAQAAVASQTAALDKAKWSFDQKQQFAPTNAFVQDTLYRPGEWVAAGNPVVVLLPPANLKARFFVPQGKLPQIKTGQSVQVSFDGAAKNYSATVNYISTQAEFTPPVLYNRENRAKLVFMVEAQFSPADAADLRPGQPVDVTMR